MFHEILEYGFMQKALLTGVVVAVICAFMGSFLVLRRYSLFGDGISHVAFGGIAVGLVSGIFPLWTAFAASILGGIGLHKLRASTRISGDAAVAVVLVSGLAVGVLLISASGGFSVDIFGFLFGSILLISNEDAATIIGVGAGITGVLFVMQKQFLHLAFSEEQARLAGLRVEALNYLFAVLAAVTVVLSMRLVGILLISALIVIPNITAMLYGRGFRQTLGISILISVSSVIFGIFLSYYIDLAPSGTIVMIAVGTLLCTVVSKSVGLLQGRAGKRRLAVG